MGHSEDRSDTARAAPRGTKSAYGPSVTRMDTHCHSDASSGPALKVLGLIGCPECFSPPEKVYEQAMARGMDLFTLTDHDTIRGAMSLVERGFPNITVGEEVTVHFPEDRCKVHILVWTLTPEQHEAIARLGLRDDIYDFASWLHEQSLPHSLAHPLYVQNHRLKRHHLDRCALLFKGFETLNGAHSGDHGRTLDAYLRALTPGRAHRLIQEHGLEPHWARIWEKARTGGSDDHGLLNTGRTWTSVPGKVTDGHEFFRLVMAGRCEPGGVAGHASLLAHQLATVGAHYAAERILPRCGTLKRAALARSLNFLGVPARVPSKARLGIAYIASKAQRRRVLARPLITALSNALGPVLERYSDLVRAPGVRGPGSPGPLADHDRMAAFADDLHSALHALLADSALRAVRRGALGPIIDHAASYILLELSQLPYLFSLFHQNKERPFMDQIEHEAAMNGAPAGPLDRRLRVMLFTDTLGDVNGVSRFIRNAAEHAHRTGRRLEVVTSSRMEVPDQENIRNFQPLLATRMPKYEHLEVALPPLVRMLRHADAFRPDVIHVSTPGPVGAVGCIAARMLKVPLVGVYHTDFPAYVERLFDDQSLTHITQHAMRFFYRPFRAILARSQDYAQSLTSLGIAPERISPLKPGIMIEDFHPRFKDPLVWNGHHHGEPHPLRAVFVGRVSVEKNLPMLSRVWQRADRTLREMGLDAELIIVGDGPYRAQMESELKSTRARFLGFRHGAELSRLYASSDLFLFPSITDTLGQVVMESQASGLPVIVTDQGGPKEVVIDGATGFVMPHDNPDLWVARILSLAADEPLRRRMGAAAHQHMQGFSLAHSFDHFWEVHEQTRREWLIEQGTKDRTPQMPKIRPEPQIRNGSSIGTISPELMLNDPA